MMIASYAWVFSAHQNAANLFSSLVSVGGLIGVYCVLCMINTTSHHSHPSVASQRDLVNTYIDEVLTSSAAEKMDEINYCAFLLASLEKSHPNSRAREQFSALLNLVISFGLGLLILIILSAITLFCYPRQVEAEEETFEQRRAAKGFRLLTLGLMLRRYHVKLKAEDRCDSEANCEATSWMIPKPGVPNDEDQPRRKLSDRCAICLEYYSVGEKVAYSSNAGCVHAFHESCVLSWMLPHTSSSQQCPCCRQLYLSMQDSPDIIKKVH